MIVRSAVNMTRAEEEVTGVTHFKRIKSFLLYPSVF